MAVRGEEPADREAVPSGPPHPVRGVKTLVFLVGPPAVGKMTVGYEIAARTGLRLFHNHHVIEPLLEIFPFGSAPFSRLVREFRHRVFEEVAASELPGMIFTYVWAFDEPEDDAAVERLAGVFRAVGGRVLFVELEARLEERLRRNESELRLEKKPSKRDLSASRARLLENGQRFRLNSEGRFAGRPDYLVIDNTELSPADVAERVIQHFDLPRLQGVLDPG